MVCVSMTFIKTVLDRLQRNLFSQPTVYTTDMQELPQNET